MDIDIPAEVGGKDVGRGLADFDPAGMVADDEDEWMRGDSESEWDEDEDKENEDYGFMRPDDAVDDDY